MLNHAFDLSSFVGRVWPSRRLALSRPAIDKNYIYYGALARLLASCKPPPLARHTNTHTQALQTNLQRTNTGSLWFRLNRLQAVKGGGVSRAASISLWIGFDISLWIGHRPGHIILLWFYLFFLPIIPKIISQYSIESIIILPVEYNLRMFEYL